MDHRRALLIICVFAFVLRVVLISQTTTLAPEAYETIKQAQHIKDTGAPLIEHRPDGSSSIPLPVFPYLIAFSTLVLPDDMAYALVPNLLACLLSIAVYVLIMEIANHRPLALIGATASVFLPSYLALTLTTASPLSLAIPLAVFVLALYLKLRKTQEKRLLLLGLFILLSFTHPMAFIFLPFLILNLFITTIRRNKGEPAQQEFGVFAVFYLLWLNIIIHKRELLMYGFGIFRGNAPYVAALARYSDISSILLATSIGVIPFGLALYATYKETTGQHAGIQTIIAFGATVVIALLLKAIETRTGLALLGVVCVSLATVAILHLQRYRRTLRRTVLPPATAIVLVILFTLTNVIPTMTEGVQVVHETVPDGVVDAAAWLEANTPKDSLILAEPKYGDLIEAKGDRQVFVTEDYLRYPDAEQRARAVQGMLHTDNATRLYANNHIDYVLSEEIRPESCLRTVYDEGAYVARVLCR